jgi:hypothetical protein
LNLPAPTNVRCSSGWFGLGRTDLQTCREGQSAPTAPGATGPRRTARPAGRPPLPPNRDPGQIALLRQGARRVRPFATLSAVPQKILTKRKQKKSTI